LAKDAGTGRCSRRKGKERFCTRHYAQFYSGILDINGKKLRNPGRPPSKTFAACLAENAGTGKCSKRAPHEVFCSKHKNQYHRGIIDVKGNKIRDLLVRRGAFNECLAKNAGTGACSTYIPGRRFCDKHRGQFVTGIINGDGIKIRNFKVSPPTHFEECVGKNAGTGPCNHRHGRRRFCSRHEAQYKRGIIDIDGKKLRDPQHGIREYFEECLGKNAGTGQCTFRKGGARFCRKHWSQYNGGIIDHDGKKIRDLKNNPGWFGGCLAKNSGTGECYKYVGHRRFCLKHQSQYVKGIIDINGNRLRKKSDEYTCSIPGCNRKAGKKFEYCKFHYYQIVIKGRFEMFPSLVTPPSKVALKEEKRSWSGRILATG
jgi:hypothetical protein